MKEIGKMLKIFSDKNVDDFVSAQALVNVVHLSYRLEKSTLDALLQSNNVIYLIITCSGYGGTKFEPHSPPNTYVVKALRYLTIKGFPANNLRVRISPVFCNEKGFSTLEKLLHNLRETGVYKIQICNLRQSGKHIYNTMQDFGKNVKETNKDALAEKLREITSGFSVFYCEKSCEFCLDPNELESLHGCMFPLGFTQDCGCFAIDKSLEDNTLRYYRR